MLLVKSQPIWLRSHMDFAVSHFLFDPCHLHRVQYSQGFLLNLRAWQHPHKHLDLLTDGSLIADISRHCEYFNRKSGNGEDGEVSDRGLSSRISTAYPSLQYYFAMLCSPLGTRLTRSKLTSFTRRNSETQASWLSLRPGLLLRTWKPT